jgi:hypothetical protein
MSAAKPNRQLSPHIADVYRVRLPFLMGCSWTLPYPVKINQSIGPNVEIKCLSIHQIFIGPADLCGVWLIGYCPVFCLVGELVKQAPAYLAVRILKPLLLTL